MWNVLKLEGERADVVYPSDRTDGAHRMEFIIGWNSMVIVDMSVAYGSRLFLRGFFHLQNDERDSRFSNFMKSLNSFPNSQIPKISLFYNLARTLIGLYIN